MMARSTTFGVALVVGCIRVANESTIIVLGGVHTDKTFGHCFNVGLFVGIATIFVNDIAFGTAK
jgi:hypothetical protein